MTSSIRAGEQDGIEGQSVRVRGELGVGGQVLGDGFAVQDTFRPDF